jgi:hypothetical protein
MHLCRHSLIFTLCPLASYAASPPSLDALTSIWQPNVPDVYGALSVTNAWGTALASTSNVLGFNALEMAPFSSGWDSTNEHGWAVDSATLLVDGVSVEPAWTQWTPYSIRRNGTTGAGGVTVSSEMRWVFESQALLFEANITLPFAAAAASLVSVDLRAPVRYFSRADACPSWHYPTHSAPCCWNWFPPEPPSGGDGPMDFIPSWAYGCGQGASSSNATLLSFDSQSAAVSAWSFPGACSAAAREGAPPVVVDLGAPDAVNGTLASWHVAPGRTARLRLAFVFSNSSDHKATGAAVRALADSFDGAWVDARADWQARFDAAFDPAGTHFSGHLPIISLDDAAAERIYYHAVASLLALERTNYPVVLPSGEASCLLAKEKRYASLDATFDQESWDTVPAPPARPSRGLARYLKPNAAGKTPRVRGVAFSGGGDSADFAGGAGASALLARGGTVAPRELLNEAGAPWRMFMTGGGMNSTTNIFYWDNQYSAQLHAMLEPHTLARQVLLWTSSIDADSLEPSQWSFWGYDYASQRGVGNYYSTNDVTIFSLIDAYVRATGDWAFFNVSYAVGPYPNGTVASTTVFATALALASHWKASVYNASGFLADYGLAANLLECVPSYIHRVASLNAGNAFMAATLAPVAAARGDARLAASLRADAASISAAVMARLYVPGAGYFRAEYPNGTAAGVRHVMDFVYVTEWMAGSISGAVADEMAAFVARELIAPPWMRALSLLDPAAPLSNRSDHGPSGAYIGWPALTVRALAQRDTPAAYAAAKTFLDQTLFGATLGAYGQAIEIRPPGDPYKPFDVTLYNCLCAAAFADTVMQFVFGWTPPLVLPGAPPPPPEAALRNPLVPRGFSGSMSGVRFLGREWVVQSGASGLSMQPVAARRLSAQPARALPPDWYAYAGSNAVPHCPSTCTTAPPFRCLGLFPEKTTGGADACFAACVAEGGACAQATWAASDGRCFTRTDSLWELVAGNTIAACNNATLRGCAAAPPVNNSVLAASVASGARGVRMHPLAPAVTLDGWNASYPASFNWTNSSFLALDLADAKLRALARAIGPAVLRLGGSPEDSIFYDVDGTCVAGSGGDGPAGDYFCSQVKPYVYGCLTAARWQGLLEFANATGLRIVLGLNACVGRLAANLPMNFSNARALLAATAASPYAGVLAGLELGNEVVGSTIDAASWGKDADTLASIVLEFFGRESSVFVAGPDGASPSHARDAIGNATTVRKLTYHHYPGCEPSRFFALDVDCLAVIDAWGSMFAAVGGAAAVDTWAGETAEHGGGGVAGLTDTFSSSLYYAWQLGALPLAGVELSARQALVGGNYQLLSHDGTFTPNPDFYVLWLFRALISGGGRAFPVELGAPANMTGVRVFAFDAAAAAGGPSHRVVMAVSLNTVGARIRVALSGAGIDGAARTEWHLTGSPGVRGAPLFCNGKVLAAAADGKLPSWQSLGVAVNDGGDLELAPSSIAFALF